MKNKKLAAFARIDFIHCSIRCDCFISSGLRWNNRLRSNFNIKCQANTLYGNAKGGVFTCTTAGQANSIKAYLDYSPSTTNLATTASSGTSYLLVIKDNIVGQRIQLLLQGLLYRASQHISSLSGTTYMKAAIYTDAGGLVANIKPIISFFQWSRGPSLLLHHQL